MCLCVCDGRVCAVPPTPAEASPTTTCTLARSRDDYRCLVRTVLEYRRCDLAVVSWIRPVEVESTALPVHRRTARRISNLTPSPSPTCYQVSLLRKTVSLPPYGKLTTISLSLQFSNDSSELKK